MPEINEELEITNYYLGKIARKPYSAQSLMNNPYFMQRMSCDEKDKEELKNTVKTLMDVVDTVRNEGYLSLSRYTDTINNPVAKHSIKLLTSQSLQSIDSLAEAILPYLAFSNIKGKELLQSVLIYECIYDAVRGEDPVVIKYKLYGYLGMLPE